MDTKKSISYDYATITNHKQEKKIDKKSNKILYM